MFAGTTTPLHCDPYENLYCQVWGSKQIWLVDPGQTSQVSHRMMMILIVCMIIQQPFPPPSQEDDIIMIIITWPDQGQVGHLISLAGCN